MVLGFMGKLWASNLHDQGFIVEEPDSSSLILKKKHGGDFLYFPLPDDVFLKYTQGKMYQRITYEAPNITIFLNNGGRLSPETHFQSQTNTYIIHTGKVANNGMTHQEFQSLPFNSPDSPDPFKDSKIYLHATGKALPFVSSNLGNSTPKDVRSLLNIQSDYRLSFLMFTSHDPGIYNEICALVTKSPHIKELHFEHFKHYLGNPDPLCKALTKNKNLRAFYFDCSSQQHTLSLSLLQRVSQALKAHPTIEFLSFYHNKGGPLSGMVWADLLDSNLPLKAIRLGFNNLGDAGVAPIACVLGVNKTLTHLDLSFNDIGERGIGYLANSLHHNSTLKALNLRKNSFGPKACESLGTLLALNHFLSKLILSGNKIDDEAFKLLISALGTNQGLKKIDLYGNKINTEGILSLAEKLKTNTTLSSIDLGKNSIQDGGAKVLAQGFKDNSSLRALSLEKNKISDEGAKALLQAFRGNTHMKFLRIDDNPCNVEYDIEISDLAHQRDHNG